MGTRRYKPAKPSVETSDGIRRWATDEFDRISQHLNQDVVSNPVLNVAPDKPRQGQVAYADGTNWNPGNGAGLYQYTGSAWKPTGNNLIDTNTALGTSDTVVPSQKAVKTYVDAQIATVNATIAALFPVWLTSFTPVVTSGSGTLTTKSATCHYFQVGKTVFIRIKVTITTVGTGAGSLKVTLPVTAKDTDQTLTGYNNDFAISCMVGFTTTSQLFILFYDGTTPCHSGSIIDIEGVYEAA